MVEAQPRLYFIFLKLVNSVKFKIICSKRLVTNLFTLGGQEDALADVGNYGGSKGSNRCSLQFRRKWNKMKIGAKTQSIFMTI